MRPVVAWSYLAIACAFAVVAALVPHGEIVVAVAAGVSAVAVAAGAFLNAPTRLRVWLPIAGAFAAWAVATALSSSAISIAGADYATITATQLPAYVLLLAGLVNLLSASGRIPLGHADASIAFIAGAALLWPLGLEPNLSPWNAAHATAAAMLVADLVALTIVLRVAFTPTIATPSFRLLLGSIAAVTAGDVLNVSPALAGSLVPHLLNAAYTIAAGLAAAAALHGSARLVPTTSAEELDPSPWRTLIVLSTALFAPFAGAALNEAVEHQSDVYIYATLGLALVSVALAKVLRILHRVETLRATAEESEQRFRMMFDSSGIGISLGANGMLTQTNEAYQRMLGYTAGELSRMHYKEVTHPDDVGLDEELAAEVAAGQRSSYSTEKRYVRRDGEVRWVNVTVTMAKDRSFGVGMIEDITDRRGLEEERQSLLARTVEVAEAERSSLAADLHDGPIQHLTAVTLTLDMLANKLGRGDVDGATELAQWLRESIAGEMRSLRRLMTELRPALLDERGLEATLVDCAAAVLDGEPVAFTLECGLNGRRLAPELEAVIYRVVREALTNVRKHAHAGTARVSLMMDDGHVDLVVEDDGDGFVPGGTNGDHVGVLTMRERVESVGGSWTLRAAPGEGTQIRAELPRKLRALERVTL
jgi:PAS domain S-box-containing protein